MRKVVQVVEESELDAPESHDAGDSRVGFCLILNKTLMQVNRTSSIKQPGVFCGRRCPGNGGERARGRQWKGTSKHQRNAMI